jgi:hypothetical protein
MELTAALRSNVVEVVFTKVDGTERTMQCTLMESMIPGVKSEVEKEYSDSAQRVYCPDLEAWRSFRKDSVISWKVI